VNRHATTTFAAVAIIAGLTLAGCASTAGAPSTAGADGPEKTDITVGYVANASALALLVAEQQGFFEDEGLSVTLTPNTDLTKFYPALGSQYDFAVGTPGDFLTAFARGIDAKVASGNNVATEDSRCVSLNVDPAKIATSADLRGAVVGLPSLGGVLNASLNYSLEKDGLDYETDVSTVAVPIPNMLDQLKAGQVAAVVSVEPFTTQMVQAGFPVLDDPMYESLGSYPFPCQFFTTSGQWAASNPNTVAAFQRAIATSTDWMGSNEDAVRELIVSELKLPEAAAQHMILPAVDSHITDAEIAAWVPVIKALPDVPAIPDTAGVVIPQPAQ
jgi:NitT/TauT family transport system substrate-binding protein